MAAFRFRLATLLRLREADRDLRRSLLADAQRAEEIVTGRVAGIDRDLQELRTESARVSQPGTVNVDALMEMQRYELLLKAQRQAAHEQAQLVSAEAARRREALVAADQQVHVLEKLREAQQERHRHEEDRHERRQLDEVAIDGFRRKEA